MSDQVNRSGNELPFDRKINPNRDLDMSRGAVNPKHCPEFIIEQVRIDILKMAANTDSGHLPGCCCDNCEFNFSRRVAR